MLVGYQPTNKRFIFNNRYRSTRYSFSCILHTYSTCSTTAVGQQMLYIQQTLLKYALLVFLYSSYIFNNRYRPTTQRWLAISQPNNDSYSTTAIEARVTRFLVFFIHIQHIQQPLSANNATLVGYQPTNKRFIFNNRYRSTRYSFSCILHTYSTCSTTAIGEQMLYIQQTLLKHALLVFLYSSYIFNIFNNRYRPTTQRWLAISQPNNDSYSTTAIEARVTRFLVFFIHIQHIQQPLSANNATLVGYQPTNKRFIFNNRYRTRVTRFLLFFIHIQQPLSANHQTLHIQQPLLKHALLVFLYSSYIFNIFNNRYRPTTKRWLAISQPTSASYSTTAIEVRGTRFLVFFIYTQYIQQPLSTNNETLVGYQPTKKRFIFNSRYRSTRYSFSCILHTYSTYSTTAVGQQMLYIQQTLLKYALLVFLYSSYIFNIFNNRYRPTTQLWLTISQPNNDSYSTTAIEARVTCFLVFFIHIQHIQQSLSANNATLVGHQPTNKHFIFNNRYRSTHYSFSCILHTYSTCSTTAVGQQMLYIQQTLVKYALLVFLYSSYIFNNQYRPTTQRWLAISQPNNDSYSTTAIEARVTCFLVFFIHIQHIQQSLSANNATLVGHQPTNKRFIFNNRYRKPVTRFLLFFIHIQKPLSANHQTLHIQQPLLKHALLIFLYSSYIFNIFNNRYRPTTKRWLAISQPNNDSYSTTAIEARVTCFLVFFILIQHIQQSLSANSATLVGYQPTKKRFIFNNRYRSMRYSFSCILHTYSTCSTTTVSQQMIYIEQMLLKYALLVFLYSSYIFNIFNNRYRPTTQRWLAISQPNNDSYSTAAIESRVTCFLVFFIHIQQSLSANNATLVGYQPTNKRFIFNNRYRSTRYSFSCILHTYLTCSTIVIGQQMLYIQQPLSKHALRVFFYSSYIFKIFNNHYRPTPQRGLAIGPPTNATNYNSCYRSTQLYI
ncbi:hypothetical protein QYM36_002444 [Artemia franciscana]|uniref:Uncharacterized protein n=1 Tax=Artemia franciscana TaxID=6661 RepID=A0AA88I9L6_ARTSF|nr:hypothetical protein QYM36_002444 [Artemia franciscana]